MAVVHPTAQIAPGAVLGDDVEIGPYCVLGPRVALGDGVRLVSHVVVEGVTELGPGTVVHPFAVLGGAPQHLAHRGEATRLVVGARNTIREHVTMHTGTVAGGGLTQVGSDGLFMVGAHVAHDCLVGDHVVFANNATLGGHVHLGDYVTMGGLSAVHQHSRVGRYAFIGGLAAVTREVIPFGTVWGNPAHLEGLNLVGLKRRGFSREVIDNLRSAYRLLFAPEGAFQERLDDVARTFAGSPEVSEIVDFIRADASRAALPAGPVTGGRASPRLGLVAGGGPLPVALAQRCRTAGRPLFVLRLRGFAGPDLEAFEGAEAGLAELGKVFALLRQAGCAAVCFAGVVARPDFATLKPDLRGLKALPGAIAAARRGDDALMRFVLGEFAKEGFVIEGAHEVDAGLTLPAGPLGKLGLPPEQAGDAERALAVARQIGALDIGQGAVVADGLVLAVEAQEGTEAMLRRCADLPAALRGSAAARRGVVAKAPKPIQERRIDLPVIGPDTVERAAAAGLAGVVGEAGAVLVVDRAGVVEAADRLGLFVVGIAP